MEYLSTMPGPDRIPPRMPAFQPGTVTYAQLIAPEYRSRLVNGRA
jgi:hypothetical protein